MPLDNPPASSRLKARLKRELGVEPDADTRVLDSAMPLI